MFSHHPDKVCAALCLGFALWCLLASQVTKTFSHVDRLWSITPVVYVWVYAALSDWSPRLVVMAVLSLLWAGPRLIPPPLL